jgi:hypothetical protein
VLLTLVTGSPAWPAETFVADRCEVVPLPGRQASFRIDGQEQVRWHFGPEYPRPFFYPFNGPSGTSLTRMGHPGAANHDHHRSIWIAHQAVDGIDFWSDQTDARIRQKHWYCYQDGDSEAVMASLCGWYDGQGREIMEQDIVAALIPVAEEEHALEIQITMRPARGRDTVELGKTNFGFLAVRVAKSISEHFGGGKLTSSEGPAGEREIFGKRARWMDYSGPLAVGTRLARATVTEGITYFDHPKNPRYPTHWHVREDGWMGASFCMAEGHTIGRQKPLRLRYLLHAHSGPYHHNTADAVHSAFVTRPAFVISQSTRKHLQFEVMRHAE